MKVRGLTRVVALTSMLSGVCYLGWRMLETRDGVSAGTWSTLMLAEVLGMVVFAFRTWQAWPSGRPLPPRPTRPEFTVVVDATGAPAGEVRTTLVAVRAMSGRPQALVVDERGDRWMRTVAGRLGAVVLGPDVVIDAAILGASTEWVLHLRPGDVPAVDLIDRVADHCTDAVAIVQLAVEDLDPSPLDDGPDPVSSADSFERQVMRPALAARISIPWYGDSPALIRRRALAGVGAVGPLVDGVAVGADRWWRSGGLLVAPGERITAVGDVLVRSPSPRQLEDRLRLRRDITSRRLRALRFGVRPGRPGVSVLAAHLAASIGPPVAAIVRVLQVAVLVLVLAFGQIPLTATALGLAVVAVPAYLLRWTANLLIGRGHLGPLTVLRAELRSMGADLASMLPPSSRPAASQQRILIGVLAALVPAAGTAIVAAWRSWDGHLPGVTAAVALTLAATLIGVTTGELVDSRTAVHRRADRRVRLGMVTCRVEEHEGFLVDLSSGGVSVALPASPETAPPPGSTTTLSFRVPDAGGRWRGVSTLVHVVRSKADGDGGVRLGLEFDDPTAAPLDAVAEFLTTGSTPHFAPA